MKTHLLFAIALAGLLSAVAVAQPKARANDDDLDQKEVHDYVLSMDKIHKLGGASKALMEESKRHPELDGESSDSKNLDEMVKKIQKYPEAVSILSKNGLSPREYAVGFFTLIQASIAVGAKKSGAYKEYPPKMLQLVSKQNLDLVEQHFDEIQKLTSMEDKEH
jgi:hypothetical protein